MNEQLQSLSKIDKVNMILYRVHSTIRSACDIIYLAGSVSTLNSISQKGINRLLERGTITEVSLPPLCFLVDDKSLVEALLKIGIEDVAQLLCTDLVELSEILSISETILVEVIKQIEVYINPRRPR